MLRRTLLFLAIVAAVLPVGACQRLNQVKPTAERGRGEMPLQKLPYHDAIPADYGDLVGVTSNPDSPLWAQLWFERPDKSIVVVWVNSQSGAMLDQVLIVPRK